MKTKLFLLIALLPFALLAQPTNNVRPGSSAVMVDTSGVITSPANFATANGLGSGGGGSGAGFPLAANGNASGKSITNALTVQTTNLNAQTTTTSNLLATNITTGTVTATNHTGNGAGLTNLTATNITGIVPVVNGGTGSNSIANLVTTNGPNQVIAQVPTFLGGLGYGHYSLMPSGSANAPAWFVAGNPSEAVVANVGTDYGLQLVGMNPYARGTINLGYSTKNSAHYSTGVGGSGPVLTNTAGDVIGYKLNQFSIVVENENGVLNNMPMVGQLVNNYSGSIAIASSLNYGSIGFGAYPYLFTYPSPSGFHPLWGMPDWNRTDIFTNIAAWSTNRTAIPQVFWAWVEDPFTGNSTNKGSITASNGFIAAGGQFTGSGAGLTGLPATSLTGTLPDARLSANVPLLNANNIHTGTTQTFVNTTNTGTADVTGASTFWGNAYVKGVATNGLAGYGVGGQLTNYALTFTGAGVSATTNALGIVVTITGGGGGGSVNNGDGVMYQSAPSSGTLVLQTAAANSLWGNFTGSTATPGYSAMSGLSLTFAALTATTFTGSGSGLTGLPAGNLTGSIADARLSGNVPLINANQTFTGNNSFTGTSTISALTLPTSPTNNDVVTINGSGVASHTSAPTINVSNFVGTLPDALLSTNVMVQKEAALTFVGTTNVIIPMNTNLAGFTLTLTANANLLLTNAGPARTFYIKFLQDATGGRTVTAASLNGFLKPGGYTPIMSAAANAKDTWSFIADGTNVQCTFAQNFQ